MDVGIGLPSGVPGATCEQIVTWATAAEAGPFASLATVDRVRYDCYDPLIALAAAAAVTQRVHLVTSILIAPLRETTTLAKQVASLHALSGGRLVLGCAIGARGDDYDGSEFAGQPRGARLDDQLTGVRAALEDGTIVPSAGRPAAPPLLVGGASGPALDRAARQADGWIFQGGPPRAFARAAEQVRTAWHAHGRVHPPRLWAMGYYALGAAAEAGRAYLLDYYAFTGAFATRIADGLLTTPLAVRETVGAYADAGCEHLVLFPAVASPDQVDTLADALGG